ncbi:MAG: hypothetical protein H7257_07060 [Taibaiella sp.]|nr:hypothetical protein [Taibaiella sp.]
MFLICAVCGFDSTGANQDTTMLKRGMANHRLKVSGLSLGGYLGKCLRLRVTNTTQKELKVTVDPGLIFTADDSVEKTAGQPLVTWGNETLVLKPSETRELEVNTFCGNLNAHCPRKNLAFSYAKQADTLLIKALVYGRENGLNSSLMQSGVWAFTNHMGYNTVYGGSEMQANMLSTFIADLTHKVKPEYYKQYKQFNKSGEAVYNKDSVKIVVPLKWSHEAGGQMFVTVYKENGDIYKKIEADRSIDKTGYTVLVEFNPHKDLNGAYIVEARDKNNKVWQRKLVDVDFEYRGY